MAFILTVSRLNNTHPLKDSSGTAGAVLPFHNHSIKPAFYHNLFPFAMSSSSAQSTFCPPRKTSVQLVCLKLFTQKKKKKKNTRKIHTRWETSTPRRTFLAIGGAVSCKTRYQFPIQLQYSDSSIVNPL